jgi:hypothetical protein
MKNTPESANIFAIIGSRGQIKASALDYCFNCFEEEDIWLVDSHQIFDPYTLSRKDPARTRQMLFRIRVCRPFTFYQLKDKIFSFTKITLNKDSTIIISSIDCFADDIDDADERLAILRSALAALRRVQEKAGCRIIMGLRSKDTLDRLLECWGHVTIWEEQFCRQGTRSTHSLTSFGGS